MLLPLDLLIISCHVLSQVLSARAVQTGLVEIQPWTAAWMQRQLPQLRLLLHALEHVHGESVN